MIKTNTITQPELIKEFFEIRPKESIETSTVADWAIEEYKKRTGKPLRDHGRAIRTLCEEGFLEKLRTGVYRKK